MKRFYKQVTTTLQAGGTLQASGWQVTLDGRGVKTVSGKPQLVPTKALADALAAEWAAQGEEIKPASFLLRDMADYAIDVVTPDPAAAVLAMLPYAETDTLCYRAAPGEPIHPRQIAVWEPLLTAAEHRWDIAFERVSGVLHHAQPEATVARLSKVLQAQDPFTLAALRSMAGLAASLVIALAAIEGEHDADDLLAETLWNAANLEEDFQAEFWGVDAEAAELRARRLRDFTAAMHFAELVRENL